MIVIDHYSDLLCIWAYVAQARMNELQENFADELELRWHWLPVFGDVPGKLATQWADRGHAAGYAAHVREVASGFEHVSLHASTWSKVTPTTSASAHLWLCGARLAASEGELPANIEAELAWTLRLAFFRDAQDISDISVLAAQTKTAGVDPEPIFERINNGEAHAALCCDMALARDAHVRSSPTLIFNEDRQRLTGNVGYRIIEANVRELLDRPQSQHSWC